MDWQTFGAFAGILALWSGFILGAIKWLLDHRLGVFQTLMQQALNDNHSTKGELAAFKAEVARDYLRREDWVRQVAVLDGKIDQWVGAMGRTMEEMRKILYDRR